MQSVHRQFGKLKKRSTDDSQVAVILQDYLETEKLLGKIIESTSAWRDAWSSTLLYQERLLIEFDGIYAPIIGSSDSPSADRSVPTPPATLARTGRLREEYEELRKELTEEINAIDDRIIRPTQQAKDYLAALKKPIKKRDDRKLDYERYQSRLDSYAKKKTRSDRDNLALAKAESDLAVSTEEYNAADDHLRRCLPPLIAATHSLLPRLLATQVEIQNAMLGHYYTVVHNYCEYAQFPSPPPSMEEVVRQWEQDVVPVQNEIESFACLANGKVVRLSHQSDDQGSSNGITSRLTNNIPFRRRPSAQNLSTSQQQPLATSPGRAGQHFQQLSSSFGRDQRSPSAPSIYENRPSPSYGTKPSPNLTVPGTHFSPSPNELYNNSSSEYSARTNHFGNNRQPSSSSRASSPGYRTNNFSNGRQASSSRASSPGYSVSSIAAAAAAKKKAPPPPPPRLGSSNGGLYVTALYDFAGQNPGDLAFREGDRIRVIEKTDSTDDWWEGELRGVKGSFPANYIE